jgi:MFS superfamily sulfate permease-like transporter
VLVAAIPIALLTYLESVSVGRKYALVHKYALDMTQELWALGFGCLFASFFQAYPPGGSFSRTALKHEVGDGWEDPCWERERRSRRLSFGHLC